MLAGCLIAVCWLARCFYKVVCQVLGKWQVINKPKCAEDGWGRVLGVRGEVQAL